MKNNLSFTLSVLTGMAVVPFVHAQEINNVSRPNIVVIIADDLGYGDLSCYTAHRFNTPGMDRIANEGIRFTNGHCTAATSTPSRYSLLTGMYPWTNIDARILPGNAALIIGEHQLTLPRLMQKAGYVTGTIGKWHLGLGDGNVDWNKQVYPGAKEVGYDYSFIQAATNDRVPCVFLENDKVQGLTPDDPLFVDYHKNYKGEPTGKNNPELLTMHPSLGHDGSIVNGVPRIGFQKGGKRAQWRDEDMAEIFLNKAKEFVVAHKDTTFFLYYGLHQPHVPRVPNERFVGKSGMGPRGDVILEADWCVDQFLKQLDDLGLAENTIVILSSDNGPVLDNGYKDQAVELVGDHKPAGPLRGRKGTRFEGGTRIPFMLRWPAKVTPQVSDAFVCQMDLLASFADLLGLNYKEKTQSINTIDAFLGKSNKGRDELVIVGGANYAYLQGSWSLIPNLKRVVDPKTKLNKVVIDGYQLFDLKDEIAQQTDVSKKYPRVLKKMVKRFEYLKKNTGKVTPYE